MRAALAKDNAETAHPADRGALAQPHVSPVSPLLRSIELFSGGGGLALGTHAAGFAHEMLVEWNAEAAATLQLNVRRRSVEGIEDWRIEQGDIRDYHFSDTGQVDLLAGGPPCQPFSIGGKHAGEEDRRNMIPEFVRVLRELAPRAFLMENVRGLLRPAFRPYFDYSLLQLQRPELVRETEEQWTEHRTRLEVEVKSDGTGLSYVVQAEVLNAADYGVPQHRHRVFVVGFRSDIGRSFQFPAPTHSMDALRWTQREGSYWRRHGLLRCSPEPDLRPNLFPLGPPREPSRTVRDAIASLPPPDSNAGEPVGHRLQPGARAYAGHTGSPLDLPAKTLKAGDHGVPGGENMLRATDGSVRYFTVREAARLQTFPDDWVFEGPWTEAMRQIGNAVPVRLAEAVASEIARQLQDG